jgi:hypothetical protein
MCHVILTDVVVFIILFLFNFRVGKRFYVILLLKHNRVCYDTKTLIWEKTGIVVYETIFSLFDSENG